MAASPRPLARSAAAWPCSSTSCVLQYGHESAERKKTSMAPFGPMMDCRVHIFPVWSLSMKSGTCSPTCGPSLETSIPDNNPSVATHTTNAAFMVTDITSPPERELRHNEALDRRKDHRYERRNGCGIDDAGSCRCRCSGARAARQPA